MCDFEIYLFELSLCTCAPNIAVCYVKDLRSVIKWSLIVTCVVLLQVRARARDMLVPNLSVLLLYAIAYVQLAFLHSTVEQL